MARSGPSKIWKTQARTIDMGLFDFLKKREAKECDDWEQIGGWNPAERSLKDVPRWVVKELERMEKTNPEIWNDAPAEGRYHILSGRHLKYRVSVAGQDGEYIYIERKLRDRYRKSAKS